MNIRINRLLEAVEQDLIGAAHALSEELNDTTKRHHHAARASQRAFRASKLAWDEDDDEKASKMHADARTAHIAASEAHSKAAEQAASSTDRNYHEAAAKAHHENYLKHRSMVAHGVDSATKDQRMREAALARVSREAFKHSRKFWRTGSKAHANAARNAHQMASTAHGDAGDEVGGTGHGGKGMALTAKMHQGADLSHRHNPPWHEN